MSINDYPLLKEDLINTIPKHVYGNLQKFNICALPSADRLGLMVAYRDDVDADVMQELIHEKLCPGEAAEWFKNGVSLDDLIDNIVQEAIYDLAQEMGPTLEEIERSSNMADRINE